MSSAAILPLVTGSLRMIDSEAMDEPARIVPLGHIESLIYFLRGEKVMLDFDLAEIYGVETKTLNRAVKRNLDRFP